MSHFPALIHLVESDLLILALEPDDIPSGATFRILATPRIIIYGCIFSFCLLLQTISIGQDIVEKPPVDQRIEKIVYNLEKTQANLGLESPYEAYIAVLDMVRKHRDEGGLSSLVRFALTDRKLTVREYAEIRHLADALDKEKTIKAIDELIFHQSLSRPN